MNDDATSKAMPFKVTYKPTQIVATKGDSTIADLAESCIVDWIREDLPLAAQMALRPEHVRKLVLRVCGPLPAPPQDKT